MIPLPAQWIAFLAATLVLLLVPGPSVVYVVTQTLDYGRRGALLSSAGLALGDFVQALLTIAGLSALLATSPTAFNVLRYAGAIYLMWLGLRRLAEADAAFTAVAQPDRAPTASAIVVRAFWALNPKTALFFLALFTQVVPAGTEHAWAQMLLCGATFTVLGFATNSIYGCVGGAVLSRVAHTNRFRTRARYLSGAALIGLGIAAAVAR